MQARAEEEGVEIRSIALCIPNAWSTHKCNIQDYLGPILDKTVLDQSIEFVFTFEAAARARYVIKYWRQLKEFTYLMVLDFGGHFMGGADGVLVLRSDDRLAFFSPKESDFGQKGGYGPWEIEIGKAVDEQMTKDWQARDRFPKNRRNMIRAAFLDKFFQDKANLPWNRPTYRLHIDLQNELGDFEKHRFAIDLPVESLKDSWEKAYRGVLDLAKDNIRRAATKDKRVFVLLSGGSIANLKARDEIQDFCGKWGRLRSQGTDQSPINLKIMSHMQANSWKWTIAKGAAHCLADTMDVRGVFDKGATLALQATTPKGNFTAHTSGAAKVLFCKVGQLDRSGVLQEIQLTAPLSHREGSESIAIMSSLMSKVKECLGFLRTLIQQRTRWTEGKRYAPQHAMTFRI